MVKNQKLSFLSDFYDTKNERKCKFLLIKSFNLKQILKSKIVAYWLMLEEIVITSLTINMFKLKYWLWLPTTVCNGQTTLLMKPYSLQPKASQLVINSS